MSFTSNFLKSLQEKGVDTTKGAGGSEPSASSGKSGTASGGNDFTTNFLTALEKQNSMTISDKVTRRVQAMERSRTPSSSMDVFNNAVRNAGRSTTSGGYYSRPTLDTGTRLYDSVKALEPVLNEKRTTVETARSALDQKQTELQTVKDYLTAAKSAYDMDPNDQNAKSYNEILGAYNLAREHYVAAYDAYSVAYDDYKPYEDQLIDALAAYQLYTNQQQSAFNDWRRTIRDPDTIKQELDAINSQLTQLKQGDMISGLKAFTGNMVAAMAPSGAGVQLADMQHGTDSTAQIRELEAARELLQEEYDWSQYYKYTEFANASDFADKSRYVSTANGKTRSLGEYLMIGNYTEGSSGWDDPLYEYINGNEEAGAYISNMAASSYGTDNALGALFGRATESKSESQQMTEREVATFNYLYATQGKEAAHAYYQYLQSDLNYRQRQADEEYWAEYAKQSPVLSSVFSTILSPTKGLSYIGQAADYMTDGTIDQNAAYNKYSYAGSAIRGQVAEELENSGKWGSVGSFAYQTGMSMADFLLNTAITGGSQPLTLAIMGTGAAADTTISAKDRGLSDDQSFALGAVAGIAEMMMEKVSLEALLNPSLLRNGSLKYIFKNMLAEGSEEVGTDVINLFADILISKDQSEWQQSIDAYMREGKSEEEAFGLALADQALMMGADFLGGAISGGIMSTGAKLTFNKNTAQLGHQLEQLDLDMDDIQAFIDTGLDNDPDSDAYHIAVELQEKIDAGEQITSDDLSRMYQANVQAVADEEDRAGESGTDYENAARDNENDQFVTQNHEDVTPAPENVPLSVAERIRQEQALNGGMEYGRTGPYDGSTQWNVGQSAGEQAGRLAGGAEQRGNYADAGRAAVARQNLARHLRLEKVSSQELGLQTGTETRNVQVMPQEHWDSEMSQVADRIYNETGKTVTYVMGRIQIRNADGSAGYARGVITDDRIIIQADHYRLPIEKIADHEAYHAKVDYAAQNGMNLNTVLRQHIIESYSEEEFFRVLEKYIVALRGVYDVNAAKTRDEYKSMVRSIEEELFADAYAGINAFGANADQFAGAVDEKMGQYMLGKQTDQDNGTEQPTGPPDANRFSTDAPEWISLPTLNDDSDASYDGHSLSEDPEVYSYSFLTAQPNMHAVQLPDVGAVRDSEGKINTASVVEEGMKNALSVGSERAGKIYVTNRYTGRELWVTASSIRHGLNGSANRLLTNARLGAVIGDIAQNSIPINALHNKADGVDGTYAMAGYAIDDRGREFISIVTVEQRTNTVAGISAYDMTHAVSGRQKRSKQVDTKSQGVNPSMLASEISIADLLDAVKSTYRSILSNDVLEKMGETKSTDGYYTGRVRYSYAGQNANNADLEALARAKEMKAAGVADETIRQQTGWFEGMDGKWRFEIDDSSMRYDSSGDLRGAESARWAREDYESAREDLWGHADLDTLDKVRAYNRADVAGDETRKRELYAELINGRHAYYFAQYVEALETANKMLGKPKGGTLQDYIDHPALFEAYPQLRDVGLRFERMAADEGGHFNRMDNEIVLNEIYRGESEDVLVHEIQHTIQKAEGFARGSSPEYWEHIQSGDSPVTEFGEKIRNGQERMQKILSELPDNIAEQFRRFSELDKIDPDAAMKVANELSDGPYSEQFNDYFMLEWSMEEWQKHNRKRGKNDLYRNTAGEIEARDAADRRLMDSETRRATKPAGADKNTVFVEDADDLSLRLGERFSVDDSAPMEDAEGQQDYTALQAEFQSDQRSYQETWWREKLGDEGYEQYRRSEAQRQDQQRKENRQQQRQNTQRKAQERRDRTAEKIEAINRSEEKKLQNADKPTRAKRNLRNALLNQFSIPSGKRAEMGSMIDSYADRLIKNGRLTEDDRKHLFDRLYDSGVMTAPANEYFAEARAYMKGGKIYVPARVVNDFGDDWNDIRRRAFAAGIYLTRSQTADGHATAGIDMWNHDLATELPGLFDSEETDERVILERIIQVAEEGKEERLSLHEYTARLAGEGFVDPDEFLNEMERQVDWALRSFASEADLEVSLKKQHIRETAAMNRQSIRQRARMAEERDARREMDQRQRDRKELQELQQRTLKQLQWLSKNRNRAPEELKEAWDEVLGDIDLYAVGAANEMQWSDKYHATWQDVAQMYKDAKEHDPNFMPSKDLERIIARLDGTKIADMDLGALQDLYKAAVGLRTEFYNRNNVISDEMQRLFAEVYADSKREIEAAPGGFTGGIADKLLNMDQLTPMNVLQRMAGWDPDSAFYSMAKQLEKGERDVRAHHVKAQKILEPFLTANEDWVKKADGQGKDAIWYEVEVPQLLELRMGDKPIFGPTVKVYMTPAQKVHMYLESKNMDNLRHMTGGRTFANKELYSQGKRQESLAQGRTIRLAPETVRALVSDLTPEEMELARVLDQYYNSFATQEINRVSNILYGYDKAMGKNYAPIYTNGNYTKTEFGVFDTTAEGVGNLKGRKYAANPSYNISAFDAFERSVDRTARFVGMAIPTRNWTTLMNWREQNNSTGDVITHKWGKEGKDYISDLITTLQGNDDTKTDTISSGLSKLQSNYISAIFGANPSIVLKQLGSIPLAGAYLDTRNMPTPAQMFSADRDLISRYTQELEWRTMGYTTPETKQLKDNPNWTQTNKTFKFIFGGGAITAMDGWAASTLWPWAENKVRREHPELEIGTKAQIEAGESPFYKKVAEEFNNAVSRSQSVSDEIHQGRLRKSKNPITRAFTMFRSDSAQTYNTLRQKIGEARFYARTGAKDKVLRTAKKAVGTAFMAILVNALWGEAINFLMALWKNKAKNYRDDEEELTVESVAGEMVSGMMGSFAGVVTGGEEVLEVIGNILTGEKLYDIETPGMEQLNDVIETISTAGGNMRELVAGGWDIVKNGGDLGAYFGELSGQILGSIKDLAVTAATYLPGLPATNLEAYLIGALKWVSPELGTAYDDMFEDVGKSDLSGMEGGALVSRIGGILNGRGISESDDTTEILAALYEAGYREAMPGDVPTSISVNGEARKLGVYQQQSYSIIWGSIVSGALDSLVTSDSFAEADDKTRAKMLNSLYSYAAELARAELFEDYEIETGAAENEAIIEAGASVAECIAWNAVTSGKNPDGTAKMKSGEKAVELASWDLPYEAKREIFRTKISDSREDSIDAFLNVGMSFDQFLQAYGKYSEINGMDMTASMKAVEFSHWANDQGYTAEQADVAKDQLTYFNMTPASASRYDGFVGAGLDATDAYNLTGTLDELEPEEGQETVSDLQKWRASVDFSDDVGKQLTALSIVMSDSQYMKVEIANDFGVSPDAYITLQEIKPRFDADGNGSYKQTEIQAAIDSMSGRYTTEQKAVLWQLTTGSTSSKNNPYSRQVGQRVLDARAEAKERAASQTETENGGEYEDYSFSQAILDQLLGNG